MNKKSILFFSLISLQCMFLYGSKPARIVILNKNGKKGIVDENPFSSIPNSLPKERSKIGAIACMKNHPGTVGYNNEGEILTPASYNDPRRQGIKLARLQAIVAARKKASAPVAEEAAVALAAKQQTTVSAAEQASEKVVSKKKKKK